MLFEGLVFNQKANFNFEDFRKQYDDCLLFDGGYFGISLFPELHSFTSSYFAAVRLKEEGTKCKSNLSTLPFVPSSFSSLEDLLQQSDYHELGAAAWYSEEKRQISLYRGLFGLVPLYYIQIPDQFIAFSTSLSDLIKNPQVRYFLTVNQKRVASYGTFLKDSASSYTSETFYKEVKSVLPGHLVNLSLNHVSTKSVYRFNPSRWSHLSSASEFGEEFRSKFLTSVNGYLKTDTSVIASDLSGGLDSSSISASIKFLRPDICLHTMYNISSGADTDENLLAAEVAKQIGSRHHEMTQSEDDFGLLSLYTGLSAQPSSTFLSPSFNGSLMHYAKSLGAQATFSGSGGDSVVGSGLELINRSFEQRNWPLVKDLLKKRVRYFSHSGQYRYWESYSEETRYNLVLQNFLFRRLAPQMIQLPFTDFMKLYSDISKHFDVSYSYFLKRGGKSLFDRMKKGQIIPSQSILVDDLNEIARNAKNVQTIDLLEKQDLPDYEQSLLDVFSAQDLLSHEQNYVLGNHYQIAYNSPFHNKELFELCMAVPDIIKYGDGIGRAHFREAMKGILPETVRMRSTKAHIRSHGQQIALRLYGQAEHFLMDSTEVWNYVDREKFNNQVKILENEKVSYLHKINTWFHISRTTSLALWLEELKNVRK